MLKLLAVISLLTCAIGHAQSAPTIFIDADSTFAPSITAAMIRKHVPVSIVIDPEHAEYVLKAAPVMSKDESGAGKVARCLFLDCAGMNGFSAVSVQLVRTKDSSVVWAYQVRKAMSGPAGLQSLSEAIAKHCKDDYLKKHSE
jgi:hypothetical protein